MPELLLTLVCPSEAADALEDLLLGHPELVSGFTVFAADGHGRSVPLVAGMAQVAGHAPRAVVQALGEEPALRAMLDLVRGELPHLGILYWLTPVLERGRLS